MTFEEAAVAVKSLKKAPDAATLLLLYSLFKQGGEGDVSGDRPGALDIKGRAKYDAWKAIAGMSQEEAQARYVEEVEGLLARDA